MDLKNKVSYNDSPPNLLRIIEDAVRMFEREQGVPAHIRAHFPGEQNMSNVPCNIAMQPSRKNVVRDLMIKAVRMGADEIALVSECWGVEFPKDQSQTMEMAHQQRLHQHPDRQEMLQVLYENKDWAYHCLCPIRRKENHVVLGKWSISRTSREEQRAHDKLNEPSRFQSIFDKAEQNG